MNTTLTAMSLDVRAGISCATRFVMSVFSFVNETAKAGFWLVFDAFCAEYYYYYFAEKRFVPVTSSR